MRHETKTSACRHVPSHWSLLIALLNLGANATRAWTPSPAAHEQRSCPPDHRLPGARTSTFRLVDPRLDESRYNSKAVAAFVLAFVLPPAGIVFGLSALRELRAAPQQGRGLATAAVVVGAVLAVVIGVLIAARRGGLT